MDRSDRKKQSLISSHGFPVVVRDNHNHNKLMKRTLSRFIREFIEDGLHFGCLPFFYFISIPFMKFVPSYFFSQTYVSPKSNRENGICSKFR